jgi:hypothetical protein
MTLRTGEAMELTAESNPLTLGDGQPKPAGTWDYTSSDGTMRNTQATYTAAIFQWVKKKQRNATKKGLTIFRFKGNAGHPEAKNAARACCEELNRGVTAEEMFDSGIFMGKKSITVKPGQQVLHVYENGGYLFTDWTW